MPRSNGRVWMFDFRDHQDSVVIYVLEPNRTRARYVAERYAKDVLEGSPNLYSTYSTNWGGLDEGEKSEFNRRNPRVAIFDPDSLD